MAENTVEITEKAQDENIEEAKAASPEPITAEQFLKDYRPKRRGRVSTKAATEETAVPAALFIARCPRGEIIGNRRNPSASPFLFAVIGYESTTGELGVFGWTSSDSKSKMRGLLTATLEKAVDRGAHLKAEDLHILPVERVEEYPTDTLFFSRGSMHFMPAPKVSHEDQLTAVRAKLSDPSIDGKKRESLEAKEARIVERIRRAEAKAAESKAEVQTPVLDELTEMEMALTKVEEDLDNLQSQRDEEDIEEADLALIDKQMDHLTELRATLIANINVAKKAMVPEDSPAPSTEEESFRTKKMAIEVARERGLSQDNVVPIEHGSRKQWKIVDRNNEESN